MPAFVRFALHLTSVAIVLIVCSASSSAAYTPAGAEVSMVRDQTEVEHTGCRFAKRTGPVSNETSSAGLDEQRHVGLQNAAELSSPILFSPQHFDVLSYDVDLDLSAVPSLVLNSSSCVIRFCWTSTPDSMRVFLRSLRIDSMYYMESPLSSPKRVEAQYFKRDTTTSSAFHYAVPASSSQHQGDTVDLVVYYSGTMTAEQVSSGSIWGGVARDQSDAVYALGVGFHCNYVSCSQHWMPCFDLPSDKAGLIVRCICPATHTMVSNGLLMRDTVVESGKRRVEWRMTSPCATNLFTFAVGPYKKIDYGVSSKNIPQVVYAKSSDTNNVKITFKHLPDMVRSLERLYGDYPFEKIGYVITNNGSMEHQTMISFARGEFAYRDTLNKHVAHELAHQWFGDLVTPFDYRDAWLCESFATYSESAWMESVGGKAKYLVDQKTKSDTYLADVARLGGRFYEGILPIYDFSRKVPSSNYPQTIYLKGAVVLGMLRYLVGDQVFDASLREYLSVNAHKNATYDSLVHCFRNNVKAEHKDSIVAFFSQWVKGKGWPILEIQCAKIRVQDGWRAQLRINQLQPDSFGIYTWLPLELAFKDDSGHVVTKVVVLNAASNELTLDSINDVRSIAINGGTTVHTCAILQKAATVTSVDENMSAPSNSTGFEVYPNPASELLNIRGTACREVKIEVFDEFGRRRLGPQLFEFIDGSAALHIEQLEVGAFTLRIQAQGVEMNLPFVVQR